MANFIIETIIICVSIILILQCVPSIIRVWKEKPVDRNTQKNLDCKFKNKTLKIHFLYTTSILIIIIILLFSYKFYVIDNVFNFMSFASAIISIILAVITIIYSFYSNSRSDSQIDILNKAASDVQAATEVYTNSASTLHENIHKILDAINRVEEKANDIRNWAMLGDEQSRNSAMFQEGKFDVNRYIKGFVLSTSPYGNCILYACIKSKDVQMPIPYNLLGLLGNDDNFSYAYGFLIATSSTGLMDSSIDIDKKEIHCNEYVEALKENLYEWISNQDALEICNFKKQTDDYFNNLNEKTE